MNFDQIVEDSKYIKMINKCNQALGEIDAVLSKGINLDNVTLFKYSVAYETILFYMNYTFCAIYDNCYSVKYNFARSFLVSLGILNVSSDKERFDNTNYETYKDRALN